MSVGGWIAIAVIVLMIYGLSKLARHREISDEEFEREAKRRGSLLATGLQEFQGFLDPTKRVALEAVEREKRKTDQVASGAPPNPGKSGSP